VEFSLNLSAIYTKWYVQTFPPIFRLYAIFDNFTKIVAPPSDEYENYVRAITCEKKLKTASKSAYKRQRNACSNYAPLERTVLRTRSVTKKQTPYFRIYSRRALYDLPKLCMVIEVVETIKKVPIIFRSNAQVFLQDARKNLA